MQEGQHGFSAFPSSSLGAAASSSADSNTTATKNLVWSPHESAQSASAKGSSAKVGSSFSANKPFSNRSVVFNNPNNSEKTETKTIVAQPTPADQPGTSEASSSFVPSYAFQSRPFASSSAVTSTVGISSMLDHTRGASNSLGGSKESDEVRKKRFEDLPKQNRFFEMKHQRDALRVKYIHDGVLPDPDKAQDLSAAKNLQGKCMEMCPEFEREEREFQNEGDVLEMFPGTNRIDPAIAVKIYRRPAAGRELPLPEDVRPPSVLRQTLDYLFHVLLPTDPASAQFTAVQPFMWNRTRAIRQDFIVQGFRGAMEIECHERIARYHILCLHWKGGIGAEGWSEQQELEQLRKTIRSLTEFYADYRRSTGRSWSNEAEFRAYNLLLHMQDPETLREVEGLPREIFDSPSVQAALRLRGYAQRSNNVMRRGRPLNTEATMNLWTRFFGEIKRCADVTYLLACLAENNFSQVRAGAVKTMGKTYLERHAPLSLEYLSRMLGMDTEDDARAFVAHLNCEEVVGADASVTGMKLAKANEEKPLPSAPFSKSIVELKRGSATVQDIVDGKVSGAVPLLDNDATPLKQSLPALAAKTKTVLPAATLLPPSSRPQTQTPLPAKPSTSISPAPFAFSSPQPMLSTLPEPVSTSAFASASTASSSILSPKAPVFTPTVPSASHAPETVERPIATTLPLFAPQPPAKTDTIALELPKKKLSVAPAQNVILPSPPAARKEEVAQPFAFSASPSTHSLDAESVPSFLAPAKQKEHSLPAPTPAAPIAPPIQSKEKPKRTIESITELLLQHLLDEFTQQRITNIGHQACLREVRVRKLKNRSEFLEQSSNSFYEALMLETVEESVINFASQSIADEFRIRSLEELVLRGRQKALQRALERRKQTTRLEEVRQKLQKRGHHHGNSNSNSTTSHRLTVHRIPDAASIKAAEDGQLQLALHRAQKQRDELWKPATFLDVLEERLSSTPSAAGMQRYTVGLSVCQTGRASSQWLLVKLAVDERPQIEKTYGEVGNMLHVMDLQMDSPTAMDKERDLGLVIFELHPWMAAGQQQSTSAKMLASDRERLEKLSQQQCVQRSRWLPKLLLVCWDKAQLENKKVILQHLHLGATSLLRFCWSQVELCCLDPPQESFEQIVSVLTKNYPRNEQDKRLDLESTSEMCKRSWRILLERLQDAMSRDFTGRVDLVAGKQTVLQMFQVVTALGSKVLAVILGISETLLQDGGDDTEDVMYPQFAALGASSDSAAAAERVLKLSGDLRDALYGLCFLQVQMCEDSREEDERRDVFSFLRLWLLEEQSAAANKGSRLFPWVDYFERLLQCYIISSIEDVWLNCKSPLDKDGQNQLHLLDNLCQAAWSESEWKLHELRRKSISSSNVVVTKSAAVKRRAAAQDDERGEGEGDAHNRAKLKSRRVAESTSFASPRRGERLLSTTTPSLLSTPASASTPPPPLPRPTSASISTLQALMASASTLLNNASSL